MSFVSIGIKTSIPGTAPAATSGAVTFTSIDEENWLQISGDASAGSGSLYLLRWYPDLTEWRVYMEDKPMSVNSATFSGQFSGHYPFPSREESFVLYDPAAAITATASCARTSSPLTTLSVAMASTLPTGAATATKQDTGNASLSSIDTKLSSQATAAKQPALGTAGTPSADVISIQGVSGGTAVPVSTTARSATPTRTFVNASASSVTLLAANASRKSASFFNNSNADLYLREDGGTADMTTGFTTILRAGGGYYELPIGADGSITTGAITGIWASAGTSGVTVCERV